MKEAFKLLVLLGLLFLGICLLFLGLGFHDDTSTIPGALFICTAATLYFK